MALSKVAILFLFLCLPFYQLGITVYLSVQFLLFVFLFALSFTANSYNKKLLSIIIIAIPIFAIKIFSLFPAGDSHLILKTVRELICFIGIYFIANYFYSSDTTNEPQLGVYIQYFAIAVLVMEVIQIFMFTQGKYFGFPHTAYVFNDKTLEILWIENLVV